MIKLCLYCQEETQHYVNEYGVLECCNCEALSESECESGSDSCQLMFLKVSQTVIDFLRPFLCNILYIEMVKSYCIKQKKVTECVPGSEKIVKAKHGRLMMKCTCAECGITKTKFVKEH